MSYQMQFPFTPELLPEGVSSTIKALAIGDGMEARGTIYTKAEVVDFILDLSGFIVSIRFVDYKILEPSFGSGESLERIICRLLTSWNRTRRKGKSHRDIESCISAVEILGKSFQEGRERVLRILVENGVSTSDAKYLISKWLVQDNFLLTPIDGLFDFVVGNLPNVRQELFPTPLRIQYRNNPDLILGVN